VSGFSFKAGAAALVACASMALATPTSAALVTISLGCSAEDLILYGLGSYAPGLGAFSVQQGSAVYDGTRSTFTLSGSILGGTGGFDAGSYAFVTSYLGAPAPLAGPESPVGYTDPADLGSFFYHGISPSTVITLSLSLPSGSFSTVLFDGNAGGLASGAGWMFERTGGTCTGVAVCDQNTVGQTPGATISGNVSGIVQFLIPDVLLPVPETRTWAMLLLGFGAVGLSMRRRRSMLVSFS
jgi:hypothetical protein